jgi:hypothetical protein
MAGSRGHAISFGIGIASTARSSSGVFGRWVFGIDQSRRDRHGRAVIVKGSSARSVGTALTMLSYLASGIFGICFDLTRTTTIKLEHTYRLIRMRQYRALSRPSVTFYRCQSWAACTTNMSGFRFRQGQVSANRLVTGVTFQLCAPRPSIPGFQPQSPSETP